MSELIRRAIKEFWGPQCQDYDEDCFCCRAWKDYSDLTASDGWQPIETAPKDGTEIILSNNESSFSGFYHDGSQCKLSDGGFFFECDRDNLLIARSIHVVKWMPLPSPYERR